MNKISSTKDYFTNIINNFATQTREDIIQALDDRNIYIECIQTAKEIINLIRNKRISAKLLESKG
jgi:hypothetical protein